MSKDEEKKPQKIALVICASNNERHRNIITSVHSELKRRGDYIFYVLTNYGVFINGEEKKYRHGEAANYSLIDHMELDGCIIEANLGSNGLAGEIAGKLIKRGVPVVTINIDVPGVPAVHLDTQDAAYELLEHLVTEHGCRNINLVLNEGNRRISDTARATYRDVLGKHGIPVDERRMLDSLVGIQIGRQIFDKYDRRGVMRDADAVICVHDVCSIGLIMELESRGYAVPGDIKVCSFNYSNNSMVFRPSVTGIDRRDKDAAVIACDVLERLMRGGQVPETTSYKSRPVFGESCGCDECGRSDDGSAGIYQNLIFNKVEAAGQIKSAMYLSDILEQVETIGQLSSGIDGMMRGLEIGSYYCCLNENDIDYIMSDRADTKTDADAPYDPVMRVIAGRSTGGDVFSGETTFPIGDIIPVEARAGDILIFYPIHYRSRDFGYMVIHNDYTPVNVYNYRICHESLGNNIANLHRQMILRSNLKALEELHMHDQMTNLYNRHGLSRFAHGFEESGSFSVVMIDMDGLKSINDTFGHLAGNNAICNLADAVIESADNEDFISRYGGDEFLILSHHTDEGYLTGLKKSVNSRLAQAVERQRLPYDIGMSFGYAVSRPDARLQLKTAIEEADKAMYVEKNEKKQRRSS